jgi:hypothetical protein
VDGRGIAAAVDGTIWMATNGTDEGMVSWNAEDGSDLTVHRIGGSTPVGIALDDLGHVWTVNQGTNNVSRLTLATGDMEQFPVGEMPYTYSDFTGYQRRVIAPDGSWVRTFERCAAGGEDYWRTIVWDADAPPGAGAGRVSAGGVGRPAGRRAAARPCGRLRRGGRARSGPLPAHHRHAARRRARTLPRVPLAQSHLDLWRRRLSHASSGPAACPVPPRAERRSAF